MRDLHVKSGEHFSVVSQNEKDLMATTKNLITRTRMQREVDWGSEDFRKKILTQDYGNYEKYEKNAVKTEVPDEVREKDYGDDKFMQNYYNMMRRMDIEEGDELR